MCKWRDFRRDMLTELILLAYVVTWVAVLLVTHLLVE
jgi:hypothetical protein